MITADLAKYRFRAILTVYFPKKNYFNLKLLYWKVLIFNTDIYIKKIKDVM